MQLRKVVFRDEREEKRRRKKMGKEEVTDRETDKSTVATGKEDKRKTQGQGESGSLRRLLIIF